MELQKEKKEKEKQMAELFSIFFFIKEVFFPT